MADARLDALSTPELHVKTAEGENYTLIDKLKQTAKFAGADDVITIDGLRGARRARMASRARSLTVTGAGFATRNAGFAPARGRNFCAPALSTSATARVASVQAAYMNVMSFTGVSGYMMPTTSFGRM